MSKRLPNESAKPPRVTIKTVAEAVGVSVCTVNKALTGKPRVGEEMRRRVIEAAERLGYRRNRLAHSLSRPPIVVGVVSPDAWPAHYRLLLDGVRNRLDELSDYRLEARFEEVSDMRDGIDFLRAVRAQVDAGVNGLILAPGDYPPERRRLLWEMLRTSRIPFVLLGMNESGHDISPHLAVVEQDSRMCGRWAAELLALMTPDSARCAILAGSAEIRDHALKIAAFREELAARNRPEPAVLETRDLPELAEAKTRELLERRPDLGGIYIATENIPGAEAALERAGKSGKIRLVATGISPLVLDGIAAGRIQASVSQQEPLQGRRAVDILFQYLETGCRPPLENPIAPRIVMRSNLELFRSV